MEDDYTSKIATIGGAKGLRGDVRLAMHVDFDLIEDVTKVKLVSSNATVYATVNKLYPEGKSILLQMKEYADRTAVEHIVGADVYTQRSQMRKLDADEYWMSDLIGLSAYTTGGAHIGEICAVYGEGNLTLGVKAAGQDKEHLVPFVKALVPKVDIAGKRVEIVALPGLLDDE